VEAPLLEIGVVRDSKRDFSLEVSQEILHVGTFNLVKFLDSCRSSLKNLNSLSIVLIIDEPSLQKTISENKSGFLFVEESLVLMVSDDSLLFKILG